MNRVGNGNSAGLRIPNQAVRTGKMGNIFSYFTLLGPFLRLF